MAWHHYHDDFGERTKKNSRRERQLAKLSRQGENLEPILPVRRSGIPTTTFWGTSWCRNLESYRDFENRLPRGRSYLRQGHVLGLTIDPGDVFAYVTGSDLYEVLVKIDPLPRDTLKALKNLCSHNIESALDLISGNLSTDILANIAAPEFGLFPSPREIHLTCSCPDYANMCKHVAAVLYAVGVRLDDNPTLFFTLRKINLNELLESAAQEIRSLDSTQSADPDSLKILAERDLSELFGIEISEPDTAFG